MSIQLGTFPTVFVLTVLSGCVGRIGTVNTVDAAGCYEPTIGPYLGDVTALEAPVRETFSRPEYYELTQLERDGWTSSSGDGEPWLQVLASETSVQEFLQKVGGWRTIGNDSIVIQWRDEYNVTKYRLQVTSQALNGQGLAVAHLPDVESPPPTSVSARRITCPAR